MAVEPHRLRGGRPAVQAYRNDQVPALRGFVPVESLVANPEARVPPPGELADPGTAMEPATDVPPVSATPPAFVIEPEPGWAERTSLFGDPEA